MGIDCLSAYLSPQQLHKPLDIVQEHGTGVPKGTRPEWQNDQILQK